MKTISAGDVLFSGKGKEETENTLDQWNITITEQGLKRKIAATKR
jgi:hypothetical protein